MNHLLNIFFNTVYVGELSFDDTLDKFSIQYDTKWKQDGFPLSPFLNFDEKSHNSNLIKNFIENLLPEDQYLQTLSHYLQISKNNPFGLLKAIGEDSTGAFSFLPKNSPLKESKFNPISIKQLEKRIQERKTDPIYIWDHKPRLSVAGVQEKLPITKLNGIYGFGEGQISSTHILKFDNKKINLVLNEHLSMTLAKKAGLKTADTKIITFGEEKVLEVKRFDRDIISDTHIEKLHIIDACQVLGVPSFFKYERVYGKETRGGVDYQQLETIANSCRVPVIARKDLIEWSIINLCLGNSDAHGKNISYFLDKQGLSSSPFYDIVNISLYQEHYESDLAMGIDNEFVIENIKPYDLFYHCKILGIKAKAYKDIFHKLSSKIIYSLENDPEVMSLAKINNRFFQIYKQNVFQRIQHLIKPVDQLPSIVE